MITIIGAGRDRYDMTLRGINAIESADLVVVKTALADTYEYFENKRIAVTTLDELYTKAKDFDELDRLIVEYFKGIASEYKNIAYVVAGTGCDDTSVRLLKSESECEIIAGVDGAATALTDFPCVNYTVVSGSFFLDKKVLNIDKRIPLIIKEVDNERLAGVVKLWLAKLYGDETQITVFRGVAKENIAIYELDRLKEYDYRTTVLIQPAELTERSRFDFSDLMEIMYILRGENGCSWDKAQTHESIRQNLLEEACELVDAIDNEDLENMIEETGDVLLQSVFHSVIAEQTAEYDVYDVLTSLCAKLLTRHTHIFGSDRASTDVEALAFWEKAKGAEKQYKNTSDKMQKVAKGLFSLTYCEKLLKYAKKAGFKQKNAEGAIDKLYEKIGELLKAKSDKEKETAVGDVLFAAVDAIGYFGVSPEIALRESCKRFIDRFGLTEELIERQGLDIKTLGFEEIENFYQQAKGISENENR